MAKPENFQILKEIQIQGFKSFADRVKLELGQGLSVIVGPNGSGKSNVADAVRWVLGEQSAKSLRGSKMEDVIFAGSAQRRSVGMAEVSLVFDNATGIFPLDFGEITITRRAYRDGDGQYLINKAPCRLKDIQELFMDTGAGKEGFSIIGQGRIEEILNLKSEERRSLIEEAAGITKFRFKKLEALKRLDATMANLQRLEDILREIEGQLIPLAAQAQVAEQSLALTEKLRHLEIQGIVLDVSDVKLKLAGSIKDSETLQTKLVETRTSLGLKEAQILEEKVNLQRLDDEIQRRQGERFQVEQTLNALRNDRSIRIERLGYFNEQISRLAQEILEDENKLKRLQDRIKTLGTKQTVLKRTVEELESKVAAQEQKLAEVRGNYPTADIDRLKADLFQALAEQSKCSNDLAGKRQILAALEEQILQLEQEQRVKEQERQALEMTYRTQGEELALLKGKAQDAERERLRFKLEWDKLKQCQQGKSQELQNHKTQTDHARARLHALQSLEDSLEGYQRGVREVMLAKKKGRTDCWGLCGTVADLIKVNETYELAIETALGAGLQNVVAESEAAAKNAIAYLKTHQFGRVTFLPLDVIQGSRMSVSPAIERDGGYIGIAVDLVSFDPIYRPALEFLLGRILVVADMDAATRIARRSGYKQRIVTLEGDQVHPGGSLSGGSIQRKGGNLLGRLRELEALRTSVAELESDLEKKESEYLEIGQRQRKLEEGMDGLGLQVRQLQEQQAVLQAMREGGQNQIQRIAAELGKLLSRSQEKMEQKDEFSLSLKDFAERLQICDQQAADLREAYNQKENAAKAATGEIDALSEELMQARVRLAKWEQELTQGAEQLVQEHSRLKEGEENLQHKLQNRVSFEKNRQEIEVEQEGLSFQLEKQEQVQNALQHTLMLHRQEREGLSGKTLEQEQETQALRQKVHTLEQHLHAAELLVVRWETESQAGVNRLNEEFSLAWEEAALDQTTESRSELAEKIQELKQQIDGLGPINQAAIEEYPKMRQRQEFMIVQQKDLVEADQTLRQLISELDKTMSERFGESFKAVNSAFQEVFKELFHGGNAELHLVNPEDLLETGVEIIAQPPGKKPQLLSLLSGGERALTAIAILFALLRVKPSPFCILDEIEASLDDANVQRFAQYIHRLADFTQFIVISHRKGTMESADVLYGITMEESGVSKLLSVQLEERQDTIYTA